MMSVRKCSIETLRSREREPIHLTNVLRGRLVRYPAAYRSQAGLDCPHERFPPRLAVLGFVWLSQWELVCLSPVPVARGQENDRSYGITIAIVTLSTGVPIKSVTFVPL
jgi:hypothetical protein